MEQFNPHSLKTVLLQNFLEYNKIHYAFSSLSNYGVSIVSTFLVTQPLKREISLINSVILSGVFDFITES